LPQGGRFSSTVGGQKFDLRVQTQPCLYGEHAVLRLLPHEKKILRIEDLGFSKHVADLYERALDNPGGLILVTGPTGSGKSTTLYSGLQILARDETRKVMTIEDPIEYNINNVQQTEARPEIGLSFASSTRAFLREDPDVILIGEIRDAETAMEALRAAETGHLVLSTLHCNDAVSTIQRLIDIGMPRPTISAELLLLVSQRLARRICTGCRVEATPDSKLVAEIFSGAVPADFKFYRGSGCDRCNGRGAFGRIVVAEALPATAGLRREIAKGLTQEDLKDLARSEGWITMRDHALELVNKGIIALEELPKILVAEQLKA
jgi:type IV pilus assembly protein PilB